MKYIIPLRVNEVAKSQIGTPFTKMHRKMAESGIRLFKLATLRSRWHILSKFVTLKNQIRNTNYENASKIGKSNIALSQPPPFTIMHRKTVTGDSLEEIHERLLDSSKVLPLRFSDVDPIMQDQLTKSRLHHTLHLDEGSS